MTARFLLGAALLVILTVATGRAPGIDDPQLTVSIDGPGRADLIADGTVVVTRTSRHTGVSVRARPGGLDRIEVRGPVGNLTLAAAGDVGAIIVNGPLGGGRIEVGGTIDVVQIAGDLEATTIAAGGDLHVLDVRGHMRRSDVRAGASDGVSTAMIETARIGGDMVDSVIAAAGAPGQDGVFADGEIHPGGVIVDLVIGGMIRGTPASPHPNPGIYAAEIDTLSVNGARGEGASKRLAVSGTTGSAVIDPLPPNSAALTRSKIKRVLARAIKRAMQLDVNATISVVDREGNLLAVVRMADPRFGAAKATVSIRARGRGGLEAVDGLVPTSIIAATKAGTAAFLSTSKGNAFTTRTAGFIIQDHFPPGVALQDGGPLFGVQLSSLPTSDISRLPLGIAADPGGVPLYRRGELVGGIGVEVDGVYTVDRSRVGGAPTVEEQIALAGQIGLEPDRDITAGRIFVDGVRLDYANDRPPSLGSLGSVPDYNALARGPRLVELLAPRETPPGPTGRASIFARKRLGPIAGEVPDASRAPAASINPDDPGAPGALGLDFYDEARGRLAFVDGDVTRGRRLSRANVMKILKQAHGVNDRLRAQIRRDTPKKSQVTVAVVDFNGNVLGVFRTRDAPMFGYDVAIQKARTAAFFSRDDAGRELEALDDEVDVNALQTLRGGRHQPVDPRVNRPWGRHVRAARAIGVRLNGRVAMADRTGGFLSRPNLPDGIDRGPRGPFTARTPDEFSPFNTGLQTLLTLPELVEFLVEFNSVAEDAALARFTNAVFGDGAGVAPLDANAGDFGAGDVNPGGGLPVNSLANGMQIFAGSVPLYKDGRLVGGVGVSGDGIEQDDFIAFSGAKGFQEFGPDVKRADRVKVAGGIRLPYIKVPRAPFRGQ